jgi:hypothetical protein
VTVPETGKVIEVLMYVIQGTVPWYDVTALIETETGNSTEVLMYTFHGVVACVTETLPEIGKVELVDT